MEAAVTRAVWRLLHRLTCQHRRAVKPGIGEFMFCESRMPGGSAAIWFRPGSYGARWHPVPWTEGERLLRAMFAAPDAETALSLLEAAGES
jgi:hypothetical protein